MGKQMVFFRRSPTYSDRAISLDVGDDSLHVRVGSLVEWGDWTGTVTDIVTNRALDVCGDILSVPAAYRHDDMVIPPYTNGVVVLFDSPFPTKMLFGSNRVTITTK